jgi:hypothetical protein
MFKNQNSLFFTLEISVAEPKKHGEQMSHVPEEVLRLERRWLT